MRRRPGPVPCAFPRLLTGELADPHLADVPAHVLVLVARERVPGKVVTQLMGHAKIDTTLNVYTQVLDVHPSYRAWTSDAAGCPFRPLRTVGMRISVWAT